MTTPKIGRLTKAVQIMKNAIQGTIPKRYEARFMLPGLTNYPGDNGKENEMWYISREVMNEMQKSFIGCPVVTEKAHDENSTPENFKAVAVGVVSDIWTDNEGWDCVKFIIWDGDTQNKIESLGWNVSCAYNTIEFQPGGTLNAIDYDHEVTKGEYIHIAIVSAPRQTGSKILFNSLEEESGNVIMFNSKWKGEDTMFKLFPNGKTKINKEEEKMNEAEKKAADEAEAKKNAEDKEKEVKENAEKKEDEPTAINADDAIVETPDGDVSLADLVNSYQSAKKNKEDEEAKKNAETPEEKKDEAKKLNMDDEFDGVKVSEMYDAYKATKKNAEEKKEEVKENEAESEKEEKKEEKEEVKENAEDKEEKEEKKFNHFNSIKDARDSYELAPESKVVLTKRERAKMNSVTKEY